MTVVKFYGQLYFTRSYLVTDTNNIIKISDTGKEDNKNNN